MLLIWLLLSAYVGALSVSYIPETGTPPPRRALSGLVYDASSSSNKVYIYGGRSEVIYGDMWEFDLTKKTWSEMHPASVMKPGARSSPFLTMLEESRQIVLFGGDTESGPISDVWVYDLDSEIVIFIRWKFVDTKGKAPPRAYYRAVCDYIHDGKHYIAVYGGKGRYD
jgi:hypothetical protein